MRLRLVELFRDAGVYWETDRDPLLRIAGVFYLLPSLALSLFLPQLALTGVTVIEVEAVTEAQKVEQAAQLAAQQAVQQAEIVAWFSGVWPWMMVAIAIQLLGTTIVMTMFLSPDRSTLGGVIRRSFALWPNVVLGWLLASIACMLGFLAFILPGFYLAGRTYLTSATIIAEQRGPVGGLMRGIQVARGHGWLLTSAFLAIMLANMLVGTMLGGFLEATQDSTLISGLLILLASAVSACAALASTLIQIAAYRRLAGSSTGM